MKKCLVIRYGAYGDMIIVSPILPLLKKDGYRITMNTTARGREVLKYNPYIDEFLDHDESIPADERLTRHWKEISQGYDKVINLSESIEGTLSVVASGEKYHWSKERRHKECDVNFYDRTLEIAGYPEVKGKNGELYFSEEEEKIARNFRRKHNNKFMILWALSGSAYHKTYPYAEYVAKAFSNRHKDILFVTVGDDLCRLLEFQIVRNIIKTCSKWSFRRSMIMTKYADLVIGTDTGLMHVAGCFKTPKILLLSACTEENLSKYWDNCINLSADVKCQPCHKLTFEITECPSDLNSGIGMRVPLCMSKLDAKMIFDSMETVYKKWKNGRYSAWLI